MTARELIEKHEGLRLTAYTDTLGFWTIGWGHRMIKSEYSEISFAEAQKLLEKDIEIAEDGLAHLFPYWHLFSDNRQAALLDMVFQLGVGGLGHFKKALAHIHKSEWILASADFMDSLWARQTPSRAQENCLLIKDG